MKHFTSIWAIILMFTLILVAGTAYWLFKVLHWSGIPALKSTLVLLLAVWVIQLIYRYRLKAK